MRNYRNTALDLQRRLGQYNESPDLITSAPLVRAGELIISVVDLMHVDLELTEGIRAYTRAYGFSVIGVLAVRTAQVFRSSNTERYFNALHDARTYTHLIQPLHRTDNAGAQQTEEFGGLTLEGLGMPFDSHKIIHCEQDGDFFSFLPKTKEYLDAARGEGCCYAGLIQQSIGDFATKMSELGILQNLLQTATEQSTV